MLSPSSSLPLLAKANPPYRAVSPIADLLVLLLVPYSQSKWLQFTDFLSAFLLFLFKAYSFTCINFNFLRYLTDRLLDCSNVAFFAGVLNINSVRSLSGLRLRLRCCSALRIEQKRYVSGRGSFRLSAEEVMLILSF